MDIKIEEKLPFFEVYGSNYEVGLDIGKHFRIKIQKAFDESLRIKKLIKNDKKNPKIVDKVKKLTQKYFPNYIQEIKGIARGAQIDYRKILIVNFMHIPFSENCSTLIFKNKNKNKIILAHNEDHEFSLGFNSYIIKYHLNGKKSFISHVYPGCLPGSSFGFNEQGLVITCNYVPDPIKAIGITRGVLGRWMLEASNINEAVKRALSYSPRSGGVSFNISSNTENRVINLETTADDGCITEIDDRYFHSNHYISQKFKSIKLSKRSYSTTLKRYSRSNDLIPIVSKNTSGTLQVLGDNKIFLKPTKFPSGETFYTICTALFEINPNSKSNKKSKESINNKNSINSKKSKNVNYLSLFIRDEQNNMLKTHSYSI